MKQLPEGRTLRAYVAGIVGLGAIVGLPAVWAGSGSNDLALLFSLLLAGALSERFKVTLLGDCHVSSSAFLAMAAAVLGGPRDAVIVAAVLGVSANLGGVIPAYKTLFNVSVYLLSSLAFLGVFDALSHATAASGYYVVLVATAAVMVDFAVNALLVAIAIGLSSGRSPLRVMKEQHLWLAPHYLPLGVALFVAIAGYDAIGVPIVVLLALPIAGMQMATAVYSSLKGAYAAQTAEVEERIGAIQLELARLRALTVQAGPEQAA